MLDICKSEKKSTNKYDQVGGGGDDLLARPEHELFGRQHVHTEYLVVKILVIHLPTQT